MNGIRGRRGRARFVAGLDKFVIGGGERGGREGGWKIWRRQGYDDSVETEEKPCSFGGGEGGSGRACLDGASIWRFVVRA